jgi:hypothetical protein
LILALEVFLLLLVFYRIERVKFGVTLVISTTGAPDKQPEEYCSVMPTFHNGKIWD